MIKEAAVLDGYEYVDVFHRNGVEYLKFWRKQVNRQAAGGRNV